MDSVPCTELDRLISQLRAIENSKIVSAFKAYYPWLQVFFNPMDPKAFSAAALTHLYNFGSISPLVNSSSTLFIHLEAGKNEAEAFFDAHYNQLDSESFRQLDLLRKNFKPVSANEDKEIKISLRAEYFRFLADENIALAEYILSYPMPAKSESNSPTSFSKPIPALTKLKIFACELYLKYGESRELARLTANLTENQMRKALENYRAGRYSQPFKDDRGMHKKANMIVLDDNVNWLANHAKKNTSKSIADIKEDFENIKLNGKKISWPMFYRLLKKCGFKKRTQTFIHEGKNALDNKIYRYFFVSAMVKWLSAGTMIVSLDETNVSFYYSKRKKWVNKYNNIVIDGDCNLNGLSATLLVASCQTHVIGYYLFQGALNQVHFYLMLNDVKTWITTNIHPTSSYVMMCDNLKAHRTKLIKAFCIKNKIPMVFTPKYSPEINFVENIINRIKKELSKHRLKNSW